MANSIPGTAGYEVQSSNLFGRYENIPFEDVHAPVSEFLPANPSTILDIGAGSGRDAAHFAKHGHSVVAVEPTDGFRTRAIARHRHANIEWIDDGLPDLTELQDRSEDFDLIMLTAVWMHLETEERERGMVRLADLSKAGGHVIMMVRHGPVPEGRRMFDVTDKETMDLAVRNGFETLLNVQTPSLREPNKSAGVTWTRLVFRKLA